MYDLDAFANETEAGGLTFRDVTRSSRQEALGRLQKDWVK